MKKSPVTPSGNRAWALRFQVQHVPFYTNLTFACNTETLGSLYSHTLLIPTESTKSKNQVVHKQMFKDLPSSKCPVSVGRSTLDLESKGLGSIPTGGNILLVDFLLSRSKDSDANIGIIAILVHFKKNSVEIDSCYVTSILLLNFFKKHAMCCIKFKRIHSYNNSSAVSCER